MTCLDLYNEVKDMKSLDDIKVIIRKSVLEELSGEDFTIREIKKKSKNERINQELYRSVKEIEAKEKRKLSNEEREKLKKQIEKNIK